MSTRQWSTGVNQGGFIKFTVIITTNQLHFHFRNDIPFLNKEVSKMVLGEKFC
jgi:hypothetical protein